MLAKQIRVLLAVLALLIAIGVYSDASSNLLMRGAVVQAATVEGLQGLELRLEAKGVERVVFVPFPEIGATVDVIADLQPADQDDQRPQVVALKFVAPPPGDGESPDDGDGR